VVTFTVASLSKIQHNHSKPAVKRKRLAGKISGRTAADFGQKRPKTDRQNKVYKHVFFLNEILGF
jgi:hypothetical protein